MLNIPLIQMIFRLLLWRFCNNLDPKRDHFIVKKQSPENSNLYLACIGFDGTLKTKEFDDFYRDWPNIIIADDKTIESVDKKWPSLGLGAFYSFTFFEIQRTKCMEKRQ